MAACISCVLVDVFMSHRSGMDSTPEPCDIHISTRTLLIYAATSPLI